MTPTTDWPAEMSFCPTPEELEQEARYWTDLDRIAEYDAWMEMQTQLESFEARPLEDLEEELETVRTLTPDQADVIDALGRGD